MFTEINAGIFLCCALVYFLKYFGPKFTNGKMNGFSFTTSVCCSWCIVSICTCSYISSVSKAMDEGVRMPQMILSMYLLCIMVLCCSSCIDNIM